MRADEYGETQEAWQAPRSLVGADYHAAEVFERERERIFHTDWYCVGRAEDVGTGSFVVVDVVGESVILVRDRDGVLRAFLNACRHRGARLCDGAGPVGRTIVCPYHAWTYDLSGALKGAPGFRDVPGFEKDEHSLVELPVTVELEVKHTDPGLQGDRSTGGTKPATLETGAEISVPLFINTGDKLKVDSRDGNYLGRVNS